MSVETLAAWWATLAGLRGREVIDILEAVERGAPVYPLSLITPEGAPFGR